MSRKCTACCEFTYRSNTTKGNPKAMPMRLLPLASSLVLVTLLFTVASCSSGNDGDVTPATLDPGDDTVTPSAGENEAPDIDAPIEDGGNPGSGDGNAEQPPQNGTDTPVSDDGQTDTPPDEGANPEPVAPAPPSAEDLGVPVISESIGEDFVAFTTSLTTVVQRAMIELNRSIQSGEALSSEATNCLSGYDAALGSPLLAINCDNQSLELMQPLSTLFLNNAALAGTPECLDNQTNLSGNDCQLISASIRIPVGFIVPFIPAETDPGSRPPRPFPSGGIVDFNTVPGIVTYSSSADEFVPDYQCAIDLTTGAFSGSSSESLCALELSNLNVLLVRWLEGANAPR